MMTSLSSEILSENNKFNFRNSNRRQFQTFQLSVGRHFGFFFFFFARQVTAHRTPPISDARSIRETKKRQFFQ